MKMKMTTTTTMVVLLLLSISVLIPNGRGGVDGFSPIGLAFGPSFDNSGGGHLQRGEFKRSSRRAPRARPIISTPSAITSTTTQLGITVVLPLPLTSPRLSGYILRIAESWAPSVGVLTSTLLYLAPAKAVWTAIRRARNSYDNDGDGDDDPMYGLNPLPIAILPSVAVSWLVYGLASSDPYLILGNLPGTVLSLAYLIGILPLMNYNSAAFPNLPIPNIGGNDIDNSNKNKNKSNQIQEEDTTKKRRRKPKKSKTLILTQATVLLSTVGTLSLWAILGLMTAGATDGMFRVGGLEFGMGFSSMLRSGVIVQSLGIYAASLFIVLSGSPLSTIRTVLKTKNSRTILGSLTAAQCVNTGLWTAYGLAVNDHFVWGPNIIGLGLGLVQLALKISFPTNKGRPKEQYSTAQ